MIKIVASHSMKVPADQEFSSKSFHVGLEAEVADSLDNDGILGKTRELFALARAAVVRELNGKTPAVNPGTNGTTPRYTPGNNGYGNNGGTNGNGNGSLASPKQLQFVVGLAKKNGGIKKLQDYIRENFGLDDLKLLNKKQASIIIETLLKGGSNG